MKRNSNSECDRLEPCLVRLIRESIFDGSFDNLSELLYFPMLMNPAYSILFFESYSSTFGLWECEWPDLLNIWWQISSIKYTTKNPIQMKSCGRGNCIVRPESFLNSSYIWLKREMIYSFRQLIWLRIKFYAGNIKILDWEKGSGARGSVRWWNARQQNNRILYWT